MAYFPHAFQKMLVATNQTPFLTGNGTRTTLDLDAGQVGVVDNSNHELINFNGPGVYGTTPLVYLAQGSFHAHDTLGSSMHGGYQETIKSKGINPKYVSKFYVTEPADATPNIIGVCANGCELLCETTYRLRIDIKGSPALRYLTHNAYLTVDGYTGCCTDDEEPNIVDPNVVLLQWADQIAASKIVNPFILPQVWNAIVTVDGNANTNVMTVGVEGVALEEGMMITHPDLGILVIDTITEVLDEYDVVTGYEITFVTLTDEDATFENGAYTDIIVMEEIDSETYVPVTNTEQITDIHSCLILIGAYVDTKFGDCSFNPRDHYELQPVQIYASVVDQTGDPCIDSCFTIGELSEAYQGKGYGEPLVRELILFKRYLQEPWSDDARMREVLDNTTLSEISRNGKYYVYHILHSVPRKSNPTGTMDNDQYLIKIVTTARNGAFENWMDTLLVSAGNDEVQLEVL